MPLYHFHLRTADRLEADEIGTAFPGLDEAYLEACAAIPSLTVDLVNEKRDPLGCTFEITDAAGQLLMTVPFAEQLAGGRKPRRPGQVWSEPTAEDRFERLDRVVLSIRSEAARLHASMQQALACAAEMRASKGRDWSFLDRVAHVYGAAGLNKPDEA